MESSLGCSRGQRVVGPAHRLGQWQRVEVSEGPAPAWLQYHLTRSHSTTNRQLRKWDTPQSLNTTTSHTSPRASSTSRSAQAAVRLLLLLQALPQGGRRVGGLLHLGYAGRGEADRALRGSTLCRQSTYTRAPCHAGLRMRCYEMMTTAARHPRVEGRASLLTLKRDSRDRAGCWNGSTRC